MMEAAPSSALEVVEPELTLEVLVVALDAPSHFRNSDKGHYARRGGQVLEPVLRGSILAIRPFDEQPLLLPGRSASNVVMRGSNSDRRKA